MIRKVEIKRIYTDPLYMATAVQLVLDGREVALTEGATYEDLSGPVDYIIEEGVATIEVAASSTFNRKYHPLGRKVKWFKDELGQLWVKFQTGKYNEVVDAESPYRLTNIVDRVWPAERVVEVTYEKPDRMA